MSNDECRGKLYQSGEVVRDSSDQHRELVGGVATYKIVACRPSATSYWLVPDGQCRLLRNLGQKRRVTGMPAAAKVGAVCRMRREIEGLDVVKGHQKAGFKSLSGK